MGMFFKKKERIQKIDITSSSIDDETIIQLSKHERSVVVYRYIIAAVFFILGVYLIWIDCYYPDAQMELNVSESTFHPAIFLRLNGVIPGVIAIIIAGIIAISSRIDLTIRK